MNEKARATDQQEELAQRECLRAALAIIANVLPPPNAWSLSEKVGWSTFQKAMDGAREASRKAESDFESRESVWVCVDHIHVCASALHAFITECDADDIHPHSVAVMHVLAFGRWMAVVEARLTLEMAEEDAQDCLGEPDSSDSAGEKP